MSVEHVVNTSVAEVEHYDVGVELSDRDECIEEGE